MKHASITQALPVAFFGSVLPSFPIDPSSCRSLHSSSHRIAPRLISAQLPWLDPSTKQSHVKTRRWEACFTDSAKQVATASVNSQLARLLAWLLACSLARAHKQTSSSCSLFGSVLPSFPTSAAPFVINHDLVLVGGQRRWVEGSTATSVAATASYNC